MKVYIGDAVYAETDQFGRVVLTTQDGLGTTNTIILDLDTLKNLGNWLESLRPARTGTAKP